MRFLAIVLAISLGAAIGYILPVPVAAASPSAASPSATTSASQTVQSDQTAFWYAKVEACDTSNRGACDEAVALAKTLFERTDRTSRNVAVTWMKACMAGDIDRCEIGYRRFRSTSFPDDPQPISHMFARASCYGGLHDLCRPWDDFETTDEDARALVMADVCLQGAKPNTCYTALAHFRHKEGLYNRVTGDLSRALCKRYMSGSACRVFAEYSEANWAYRPAYGFHNFACERGLQASCPDARRIKKRLDFLTAKREREIEMEERRRAAVARSQTYRSQLAQSGYGYNPSSRTPITPFGSGRRDIENWNRYNRNLCLGNPRSTSC